MTPPAATVASRRRGAGRRSAVRRRRGILALGVIALAVLAAVLIAPLFQKAIRELSLPLQYQDIIRQEAAGKHLDSALVAAVIYAESKFDPRTSRAGAEGLMQLLPQTAAYLAKRSGGTGFSPADLATPRVNIAYGSYYLRYLMDHYNGQVMPALAAYNAGITNVDRWVQAAGGGPHTFTVEDIPYPETRAYVERVLRAQRDYRQTYPKQLGYE
jgi:soluble lytic murein transglycosylase